MPLELVRYPVS